MLTILFRLSQLSRLLLQDKEAVTIEEDKPFNRSDDFCFPKRKFGEKQRPCQAHWFRQFEWLHYDEQ